MECTPTNLLGDLEFLSVLNQRATEGRIPVSGGMDITARCNLRCIHCYLSCGQNGAKEPDDLPFAKVTGIMDQCAGAGCLFFLMTGGEPLVRNDFPELYIHAKKLGRLVTVFTTGVLVN